MQVLVTVQLVMLHKLLARPAPLLVLLVHHLVFRQLALALAAALFIHKNL
jgi:hypothetical protein